MLIDLHTHTSPQSEDSSLSPDELIINSRRAGLDGICFTDHDRFWDHEEVAALGRKYDFLVLPGIEITTEEAHLLVFGLTEYVFGMHHTSFVRQLVDEAGGFIIVAHPYRRHYLLNDGPESERYLPTLTRACESPLYDMVDAIEVLNGRGAENENAFSQHIARRLNKPGVGASDAHEVEDIGRCATHFERRVNSLRELITGLKAGRFAPVDLRKR